MWDWDEPLEDPLFVGLGNREMFGSYRPGLYNLNQSLVAKSLMAGGLNTWRDLAGKQHDTG